MCFTKRKKKLKKNKIYPKNSYSGNNPYSGFKSLREIKPVTNEEFLSECIECYHCKKIFDLGSSEIKIHCAGCNQFFHCGIAGKCRGSLCNQKTMIGDNHRLSWCINCVPKIEGNEEKINGIGTCICQECSL